MKFWRQIRTLFALVWMSGCVAPAQESEGTAMQHASRMAVALVDVPANEQCDPNYSVGENFISFAGTWVKGKIGCFLLSTQRWLSWQGGSKEETKLNPSGRKYSIQSFATGSVTFWWDTGNVDVDYTPPKEEWSWQTPAYNPLKIPEDFLTKCTNDEGCGQGQVCDKDDGEEKGTCMPACLYSSDCDGASRPICGAGGHCVACAARQQCEGAGKGNTCKEGRCTTTPGGCTCGGSLVGEWKDTEKLDPPIPSTPPATCVKRGVKLSYCTIPLSRNPATTEAPGGAGTKPTYEGCLTACQLACQNGRTNANNALSTYNTYWGATAAYDQYTMKSHSCLVEPDPICEETISVERTQFVSDVKTRIYGDLNSYPCSSYALQWSH